MSVADEERAAFERYMSSDVGPADLKRAPLGGHYESMWTRGAWFGWVARSLEIDALRDALAAANERANVAEKDHEMARNEIGQLEYVIGEAERQAEALEKERDAANERAERLAGLLDAIDAMVPPKVTRHTADTDEKIDDLVAAYHVTNARADALAARLAEVEDREHPA